eukprot:Amastigsp_a738_16.p3 type:complete len:106 gc:universal Amastigsp_a738_16:956-639(-)
MPWNADAQYEMGSMMSHENSHHVSRAMPTSCTSTPPKPSQSMAIACREALRSRRWCSGSRVARRKSTAARRCASASRRSAGTSPFVKPYAASGSKNTSGWSCESP